MTTGEVNRHPKRPPHLAVTSFATTIWTQQCERIERVSTETLADISARFGKATKSKLSNPSADGEPEDQLRAPIERLAADLAVLCGLKDAITLVGESRLSDLKTRPDYAVSVRNSLCGFIEIKAPGKGADPRRYDGHDAAQWAKLQPLPNLLYTDGNEWSLWRSGEIVGDIVRAIGDVRTSGASFELPEATLALFADFLNWTPTPPRDARQLAETTARLCKLLRYEVAEQLERGNPALTDLAHEWRKLLFPEANDETFADGYAQAVTFGLLMARARDIKLSEGLGQVAVHLRETNSLIGTALRLLTDDAANQSSLDTSLGTLVRVLDAVNWHTVSRDRADAWLYFYEEFLAVYDNDLRKLTGSYYTPPQVVTSMVRLVNEALVSRFSLPAGLAAPTVTIADPAVGTGTFLLGVLQRIAATVREDQGEGSVPAAIDAAVSRLIGFEMQLGPFAVAQLRIVGEVLALAGHVPKQPLRMFVTDTLANPFVEMEEISAMTRAIAESRKQANEIKKSVKITVVIGNPPYKEKAKGRGGWVETGHNAPGEKKAFAPLSAWMPPAEWGVGAHSKHLRNLYVYFWRWATWKVFDQDPAKSTGIVCYITVAGFLNGPGFQKMRDYLRRTAGEVWVIDCSPEGHQPEVNTRLFQGVQQPICIVMASRAKPSAAGTPAVVRYRSLPAGHRTKKFEALNALTLEEDGWTLCPTGWRDPFLPAAEGAWATYPKLETLFVDHGSGVMPGRTWVIAPDAESLAQRWDKLIHAPAKDKQALFHPHLRNGQPGDKHIDKIVAKPLAGFEANRLPMAAETGNCPPPISYAYRSFDRQWIIPDPRLINQPNPELWASRSDRQFYLTALCAHSPTSGPALSFAAHIPDLHHYKGSFGGRVFSLWRDANAKTTNIVAGVLSLLKERFNRDVTGEDVMAYIAAILANPAYTTRFKDDLVQPGLRLPLTADVALFNEAVELGREVIWLHTFGERLSDPKNGRPASPPRLPKDRQPKVPANGAIPGEPDRMPNEMKYTEPSQTLMVGEGRIEHVTKAMWEYEVSGKQVLTQWFSYRKKDRDRPMIGDRRPPSKLGDIQPEGWPAEYTTELLNVLNVLGRLIDLEPKQASLLERICNGKMIESGEVDAVAAHSAQPSTTDTSAPLFD